MTERTEGEVQKNNEIVRKDQRLRIQLIADMVKTNNEKKVGANHSQKPSISNKKTNDRAFALTS